MKYRAQILACFTLLSLALTGWAEEAAPPAPAAAEADDLVTIPASPQQELLQKFKGTNERIREHVLNMPASNDNAAGLRLNRIWVGENATLVEIEGLPNGGRKASAVIRQETFVLVHGKGQASVQAVEGVTRLQDRRGGMALVVQPGDKMLVLFDAIDDYRPMRLQHTPPQQAAFVYFDNIDPRFRERYDAAYRQASAANATPEQMKNFLVEFARNDPDRRAGNVFIKLISAMRGQNTFEGYYHAYLLMQDPADARNAFRLARTDEHKAMMENIAVATLADKNRLLNFDFSLTPSKTSSSEGGCWMFCRYNFTANRPLQGQISLKPNPSSPIKLKQGSYKVVLTADVSLPRRKIRESNWLGSYDGPDNVAYTKDIEVTIFPPSYVVSKAVDLGSLNVAFFQRGSMGGYEGSWATDDASIQIRLKSVELLK